MAIIPENRPAGLEPAATGNGHAPYRLAREIIALSNAKDWREAKDEWQLVEVWLEPDGVCLCGHPITEHCQIRNYVNGNAAVVGNVCVTKFLHISSEPIFAGLRRIVCNLEAALNMQTVEYAYSKGYVTNWERTFYLDTMRKRKLSPKQLAKRREINERVLALVGEKAVADA